MMNDDVKTAVQEYRQDAAPGQQPRPAAIHLNCPACWQYRSLPGPVTEMRIGLVSGMVNPDLINQY